jgi:hypothetical protein
MFILGRFVLVRELHRRLARPPAAVARSSALFPGADAGRVVRSLYQEGLFCGLRLPAALVAGIHHFAKDRPCYGNLDRNIAFLAADQRNAEAASGQSILVGHYLEQVEQCSEIKALCRDPFLHEVACRYLLADPVVISARLWWSFPSNNYDEATLKRASQNLFHFDMNDWRSVKFFFYLTNVDGESGPHVYVSGSHCNRRLAHQFTLFVGKPNAEIVAFYGAERIVSIHGLAGFGFAEDPFGFHMGTVARSRPRLVLEVEFGVSPPTRRRYYGSLPATDRRDGDDLG